MASHSQSSSLADFDYYNYSHSASSSLSDGSVNLPTTSHPPPSSSSSEHVRKQQSLANIDVPSFSKFRSQVSSIPVSSPSTAKRKPLPFQNLNRPVSQSVVEQGSPRFADPGSRPFSLDSPLQQQFSGASNVLSPPLTEDRDQSQQDESSYASPPRSHTRNDSVDSRLAGSNRSSSNYGDSRRSSIPIHARYAQEQKLLSHAPKLSVSSLDFASHYSPAQRLSAVSSMNGTQEPPVMKLELDGVRRTLTDESISPLDSPNAVRPKSPGGKLGNFFGWKNTPQKTESPTTTFSDRSISPLPSPNLQKPGSMDALSPSRLTPPGLDVHKANSNARAEYFDNQDTPILIGTPESNAHVKELERELTQVSTELAESIKREMELEDEIDRMKVDLPSLNASDPARRSSDYFSDSGASSTRFPIADPDSRLEQLENKLRKVEQEKAQIKVETSSRLQTELSRRRDLEQMVQKLEEQLQSKFDEEDERGDVEERNEELESTLEDTRRLLSQERQAKGSLEDLYNATRGELEQHRNERDNLRDEVVPQLKARVEGLEAEAADTQALMYENTRMAQELASYKSKAHGRFNSIAEEDSVASEPRIGLSRSGSLARSTSRRGGSLTRSGSVREQGPRQRAGSGSGVLSAEGVKEIEDQRDALHKAMKLLIIRCEKQQRDHERAIKKLTKAHRAAEASTPTRGAYHKEVAFLKEEVSTLRKRTEDALEQKWQYEKGLSGIKMDLDRAELETRGLRIILQEHDILGSSPRTMFGEATDNQNGADKLQESISTAESERDQARKVAEEYRQRAQSVQDGSATELVNSAKRMDELADELEKQVQSNIQLRSRLVEAVAKGEREQRESNGKIGEMQKRLTTMEDSVLAAQQHSEATLGNHEAEVRRLDEASSPALSRLRISIPDRRRLTPQSPLLKSPKVGPGARLSEISLLEMSKTQMLERKVRELEALLREAEEDMQDVVQRVNASQLEVAELQTERDAAFSQMSKLQFLIVEERERVEGALGL